jgi:polyhydroxybutyrate depolymerase
MYRAIAVLVALVLAGPTWACGTDTDCTIGENRHYRVYIPPEYQPGPAIIFAHGYRGTARGTMRNKNLLALAERLGVAFIALKSGGPDWLLPNAPGNKAVDARQELSYFDAVLRDAGARFGVKPDQTMMTGFSAGGMMTWTLACARGDVLAGYVPVAGTFWRSIPRTCDAPPTHVIHIHGLSDKTVPLGGRPIADTRQGDVPDTLKMYRAYGSFDTASSAAPVAALACDTKQNATGKVLAFCTHPGGHSFRSAWLAEAWAFIAPQ